MKHLWIPFALIMALMGVRFLILWLIPETSSLRTGMPTAGEENRRVPSRTVLPVGSRESPDHLDDTNDRFMGSRASERPGPRTWENTFDLIRRPQIQICFLAFFFNRIAFSSEKLIFQYASDVLGIALSDTAWFKALQSIGATLVTGIGVPVAMRLLRRQHDQTPSTVSFRIVQSSLMILSVGFIILWLGRKPAVIGIGKCRPCTFMTLNE